MTFSSARLSIKSLCLVAGLLATVTAFGWWWLTFGDIYQAQTLSLREAAACLVRDSALCQLAASLCTVRHPFLVAAYSSALLWVGLAVLFGGSILPGRRQGAKNRTRDA